MVSIALDIIALALISSVAYFLFSSWVGIFITIIIYLLATHGIRIKQLVFVVWRGERTPIDFIFVSVIVLIYVFLSGGYHVFKPTTISGYVEQYIDGDTIIVDEKKVRLKGIDAPELDQKYGIEAKKCLKRLIRNKSVTLEIEGKDIYGRVLAKVFVGKVDINKQMVMNGCAWAYGKEYMNEQNIAQNLRIGLWQYQSPIPPWEFRRRR